MARRARRRMRAAEHRHRREEHRDTGRARRLSMREVLARSPHLKYFFAREYKTLSKYLSWRELFTYVFYDMMVESRYWPDEYRRLAAERRHELTRLALQRAMEEARRHLPMRYANHPLKVNMTLPYSIALDLAALARLAWLDKNPLAVPLMAALTKHLWCNSSRIFIRWDGTRTGSFYLALNIYKAEDYSPSPNTGDVENLTMPVMSVWLWKYQEDYTTILNIMLDRLDNMAEDRAVITRNGRDEPVHTVPVAIAIYTDYPQRLRALAIGLPEMSDTMYHCSLYYMPNEGRNIERTRPHRIYEAKVRRRYRRMRGWA